VATKVAFFFYLHKLYLYNQKKSSNFAGNLVTMRQLIFTLLTLAIILIACETPTTITTSDENRVQTFTFYEDTLNPGLTHQATYKIEHRTFPDTGLIYCKDSLKFGTRLDSVVPYITYKATPGSATFYLPNDTIISTGYDTLDLTQKPVYLQVLASDMTSERWYRIEVHAHQINPDLYVWEKLVDNIFPPQNCETKAFYINNQFVIYVNNGLSTQVYTSSNAKVWNKANIPTGIPTPCFVKDILQHNDTLYYIDKDQLFRSVDQLTWTVTVYSAASFEPITMLLSYHEKAWCIIQDRTTQELILATIQGDNIEPCTHIRGYNNGVLPDDFPISDFAATAFESSSERPRAMIVGGRDINGDPVNSRWNFEYLPTDKKYRLKNFTISQPTFHTLTGASIIQYNGQLMMFGGIDNDLEWNSNILYSDDEGMNWYVPDTACNQLPMEYQSRQNQSVIVNQKSIYLIGGQSHTVSFSDVYRGRLNSLQ
jgi:hypothetical protein